MPDIYIDSEDEIFIDSVRRHGLENSDLPKWSVLRIALAKSLSMPAMPDSSFDIWEGRSKNYDLEQVTWKGQKSDEYGPRDITDAICAILAVLHNEDLFKDEERFRRLLQRHIRRGLNEMRLSWRAGHDFYDYLYHEFFADVAIPKVKEQSVDFSNKLLSALREIGIKARINEEKRGPRITRYFLFLEDAQHLDRLRKGLDKLCFLLGFSENSFMVRGTTTPRISGLDVPRPKNQWESIPASLLNKWVSEKTGKVNGLSVLPGVDILGEPFSFDLSHSPHLLIGGTTGSGKSVCVHALLLSLLLQFSPEDLRVCLIDTKRMEFGHYKSLPHLYNGKAFTDAGEIVEVLGEIVDEMEARTIALERIKARDLSEANDIGGLHFPRIVVFIEELADLIIQTDHEAEKYIVRIAQLARAVGIHLILATQRPDAQTFSGQLRSNIPARIALTVQKSSESKIIIDQTGAEKLLMDGDMLIKIDPGSEPVRVHGIWVTRNDISAFLRAL
jgi:S-DNA-T family DNA segregation ATPase FtsK/SpoIIIE